MQLSINSVFSIPLLILGGYLLILALVYFRQPQMLYLPDMPNRALEATPTQLGLEYQNISLVTDDGIRIHGWHTNHPNPRAHMVFFHGNAGNISHRLDSINLFHKLGLEVVIIDYRGYGQSEGSPSEAGTYLDAKAAWDYLMRIGVPGNRVIIFGRSLGGAIAAHLASNQSAGGLIIESAFASVPEVGAIHYPWLPVKLLSRYEYATANYAAKAKMPKLIIHSRNDEIAPIEQGKKIFELASKPKAFVELGGSHNEAIYISREDYMRGLEQYLDQYFARPK